MSERTTTTKKKEGIKMMTYEELNAIYNELNEMDKDAYYMVVEQIKHEDAENNIRRSRNITESLSKVNTLLEFAYKKADLEDDKATLYLIEEEVKKEHKKAKRFYERIQQRNDEITEELRKMLTGK